MISLFNGQNFCRLWDLLGAALAVLTTFYEAFARGLPLSLLADAIGSAKT